jgi:photosystem II stability/assembly factor-like uncharacterized protein
VHWSVTNLPLVAGDASSGAFSIAFNRSRGVIVGGDYAVPDSSRPNIALSADGGATWSLGPEPGAVPYLSAVAPLRAGWIATGTRGTWISRDDGMSWTRADTASENAIAVTPTHAILLGAKVQRIGDPTR